MKRDAIGLGVQQHDAQVLAAGQSGSSVAARGCGLLAALVAGTYGVAGLLGVETSSRWIPAHDLNGVLAVALAVAAGAEAAGGRGRRASHVRWAAALALCIAAVAAVAPALLGEPAAGPRVGFVTRLGLGAMLLVLSTTHWRVRDGLLDRTALGIQLSLSVLWAFCLANLCALVPARVLLDWYPLDAGLSWPTTFTLTLLTAAATLRIYSDAAIRRYFEGREDRRIFAFFVALLLGAIGMGAMFVAGLLSTKVVASIGPVLEGHAKAQAMALNDAITSFEVAAGRALARLEDQQSGLEVRWELDPLGQAGVRVERAGRAPFSEGTLHDPAGQVVLPVPGKPAMSIFVRHGLVVQMERELAGPAGPMRVLLQVRLLAADAHLASGEWLQTPAQAMLCGPVAGPAAQCLLDAAPGSLRMPLPVRFDGQPWPIERAWRGTSGSTLLRDPAGVAAAVAFAPVGHTGLGLAHKLPLAPLVRELTTGLPAAVAMLLTVAAAGAALLYRWAFPQLRALRYAKAQMQATLEHLPRAVLTTDMHGSIQGSNAAAHRLFGCDAAGLQGRPVARFIAAELPLGLTEASLTSADGTVVPVEVLAESFEFEGVQRRLLIVRDLRRELAKRVELARSEALLQLVLKSLPVGVWIADRDGRIVATNPAVERLWGAPVHAGGAGVPARLARSVVGGQPVPAEELLMQRAIRTGETSASDLIDVEAPDGTRRTLVTTQVPLVGSDGAIEGAIAVQEDVTSLLRAEAAIFAAKDFFEGLFRSAAVGMAVWNAGGRFLRANQALCDLLCLDEAALLQRSLSDIDEPRAAQENAELLAKMLTGQIGKIEVERQWRRCDGRRVWVMVVVSLMRLPDAEQSQFVVQVIDIDRSRRYQNALLDSEARLLNAHRIAGLADWEWDTTRNTFVLGEAGRRMIGLPEGHAETVTGSEWLARIHPDDRAAVRAAFAQVMEGRRPVAVDYRLVMDSGEERFMHQQGERSTDDTTRLVGVLQDITDRKRVEMELLASRQRLRELSANEEQLIEEERRHIAREVHDELGQALTALKMELSLVAKRLAGDAALSARVAAMRTMVDDTIDVVRHVASNLRPAALDFGLVAAIEWLAEDFSLRWEIPCEVRLLGAEIALGDARSTALFRIVQESLTNVARHAHASRVDIAIESRPGRLVVTVQDDGIGFDVAAAQERGGRFGLLGMRERALKIGADLQVTSRVGGGTAVRVQLETHED